MNLKGQLLVDVLDAQHFNHSSMKLNTTCKYYLRVSLLQISDNGGNIYGIGSRFFFQILQL